MEYLDTSAMLKLLVVEAHSEAMAEAVQGSNLWSSTLLAVEAHRAGLRLGANREEIENLLREVSLVLPAASTFQVAQYVGTAELRTLDALHLATALEIGPELDCLLTYDKRLAAAADSMGLKVTAPGLVTDWWTR